MKIGSNPGMLLLGVWLILSGILPLLNINFQGQAPLLQILAAAAGVLILMNK
jgi:ABC-type thiamin/hydroxymethylpyrimidine transport system permease subunit